MNLNLDGSALSEDQLIAFAILGGGDECVLRSKIAVLHNNNLIRSMLKQASAKARFRAFMRCELTLDTRTPANS